MLITTRIQTNSVPLRYVCFANRDNVLGDFRKKGRGVTKNAQNVLPWALKSENISNTLPEWLG
jgi:hypothetical protein